MCIGGGGREAFLDIGVVQMVGVSVAREWETAEPENGNFTVQLKDLYPGTMYEVVGVSITSHPNGTENRRAQSPPYFYTTSGQSQSPHTQTHLNLCHPPSV